MFYGYEVPKEEETPNQRVRINSIEESRAIQEWSFKWRYAELGVS